LVETITKGGEGLLLIKPNSQYLDVKSIFKLKKFQEEKALVISQKEDGKYLCNWPSGDQFSLASNTSLRNGTVVTIKREAVPSILHIRDDLTWEDVVVEHYPYMISPGTGTRATCRGCQKILDNRHEYKIQTPMLYSSVGCWPKPIKISYCINPICILKGYKRYEGLHKVKPFEGKVAVLPSVDITKLPVVDGIEWINL